METRHPVLDQITKGEYEKAWISLYGKENLCIQRERYQKAVKTFLRLFEQHRTDEISLYSAPGRTEIGGNHTDHQHGRVLAAAINLDVIGVVARNREQVIRIYSEGFEPTVVWLNDLEKKSDDSGTSDALVRGIAARLKQLGYTVGGFDAYTTSQVLKGSGLSSSAAFEVLVGTVLSREYNNGAVDAVEIAKIGQYAENVYFGKASGLMDQMVSSVGAFVAIDFYDPKNPVIDKISFSFDSVGYCLCITDTKGNHANLTADYTAVSQEMRSVAACFQKDVLRQVSSEEFFNAIPSLRKQVSDRALLRAIHFFHDNRYAKEEAKALCAKDISRFLSLVRASGKSSVQCLQNIYSGAHPSEQGISLGLTLSEEFLGNEGACRVHGGGFAGTIQAFVPLPRAEEYRKYMDRIFGAGSCYLLTIREQGGVRLTPCEN